MGTKWQNHALTYTVNARTSKCILRLTKVRQIAADCLWAFATMSLTCREGDKSHDTRTPISRVDSTTGKALSFIWRQVSWLILPTFNTQHLLTEMDNCHSVAQLTKASLCNFTGWGDEGGVTRCYICYCVGVEHVWFVVSLMAIRKSTCIAISMPVCHSLSYLKKTCPNVTKFSVLVICSCGLIFLWRQCNMLCTSSGMTSSLPIMAYGAWLLGHMLRVTQQENCMHWLQHCCSLNDLLLLKLL